MQSFEGDREKKSLCRIYKRVSNAIRCLGLYLSFARGGGVLWFCGTWTASSSCDSILPDEEWCDGGLDEPSTKVLICYGCVPPQSIDGFAGMTWLAEGLSWTTAR